MRSFPVVAAVLFASIVGAQGKPDPIAAEKKELARLKTVYTAAKAKSKKKPKDSALKAAYSKAASDYGTATMNAQSITDRGKKYGGALRLFNQALAADPKNAEAKQNKEMIESIYRSLKKPIPH